MAEEKLTVWFAFDPEHEIKKLAERGIASHEYLEDHIARREEFLAEQGFRFNSRQLTRLKKALQNFSQQWNAINQTMSIEHVGPPKGKVPPPEVQEFLRRNPKKCCVEKPHVESPLESRSRH